MPAEQGAAKNRLVTIGSSPPREYSLDKVTIAIGSHPKNDVVIDDTTVSRRHATIERKDDIFELTDLGSTNGLLRQWQAGAAAGCAEERRRDLYRLCAYGFRSRVGGGPAALRFHDCDGNDDCGIRGCALSRYRTYLIGDRQTDFVKSGRCRAFGGQYSVGIDQCRGDYSHYARAARNIRKFRAAMAGPGKLLSCDGEASTDRRRSGAQQRRSRAYDLHRQELPRHDRARRARGKDAYRGSGEPRASRPRGSKQRNRAT